MGLQGAGFEIGSKFARGGTNVSAVTLHSERRVGEKILGAILPI